MQHFSNKCFCEFSISSYQDISAGKRSEVIKYTETCPKVFLIIIKKIFLKNTGYATKSTFIKDMPQALII